MEGIILKSIGGFYYVHDGTNLITCRARGRFRHLGITPLVGDRVTVTRLTNDTGVLDTVLERKNVFFRPPIANVDQLVLFASETIPRTDPFLLDRVAAIGTWQDCPSIICINKCDLGQSERLYPIYKQAGFSTLQISAKTGEGIETLRSLLRGKISVFTGNSGVGKSSMINALFPNMDLEVGEVSEKLGRGRHTTRTVELFQMDEDIVIADTPGFSSFDAVQYAQCQADQLQFAFREFAPYLGECQFTGCSHIKEKGCAVLAAVANGVISKNRHESYVRLYGEMMAAKPY
jgi:ribosome biogenesis GTPase